MDTIDDKFLNFDDLQCQFDDLLNRSSVEENIRTQLVEYEMLSSMFSNAGELVLDDPSILNELQDYASGKGYNIPPYLDFNLNIKIENLKFEINVTLSHNYPTEEPDIFVRNETFDRMEQRDLNDKLSMFVSSVPKGEICILSAISWLQENALLSKQSKKEVDRENKEPKKLEQTWGRIWIYSHHIYSKTKMRSLLSLAEEYSLGGFFLPGSPGIICYEGLLEDCDECWKKVKAMNWKKIKCVKRDSGSINWEDDSYRRFTKFEELLFEAKKIPGRQHNMNLSDFYGYLVEHKSDEMFKIFFNVDGKTST